MKMKNIYYILIGAVALTSCDKYLDVMPDNRTEIDSAEKIRLLLTSAYPATDYMLLTEFSSDNVDDLGPTNPGNSRFIDQVFDWNEITESDNEDPEMLWGNTYIAIANANQAIQAIEDMGGAEETGLTAEMAEALLCRAYNHFILATVFCQAYSSSTADGDLGVTYMEGPEEQLNPHYERASLAEVYDLIDKDLTKALPWVSDEYYTVPKYHFNQKAAYAFATRFYLYYEKWDEAIKYATLCLGSQPKNVLRDWRAQAKMTQDYEVIVNHYIDEKLQANLLLMTAYSKMGLAFGPYRIYTRYSHCAYLAENETAIALAILLGHTNKSFYATPMKIYTGTNLDRVIFWKLPYLFEYTDPVAGIGYYRTVYPAFTTDAVLLERAEAKILSDSKQYDSAVEDMNIWLSNISSIDWNLTVEDINTLMKNVEYSTWQKSTVKKHLNPGFEVTAGVQENLLQFCLLLKRVDGLGQGTRMFDVKRYGVTVARREMGADGQPKAFKDSLIVRDPRSVIQVPKKVIDAGYQPNPRN